jgi:site-specific DNA-methyltransferase (adenine-specific)
MKNIKPFFEKPRFTLYHADCLDVLGQLPENSVDMVFADPPYFLSSGTFTCQNGRMVPVKKADWDLSKGMEADFEFQRAWIGAVRRVLKPEGTLWVSGTYHSIYQCGMAIQLAGFKILNDISWFKPNASPNLSCRYFTASHETLIWAVKEPKAKHKFNYHEMRDGNWPRDKWKKPHRQMRSVWCIDTPRPMEKTFGKHPTQKPIDLLQRIVLASTDKNDLILDPFAGSSTTGLAAYYYDREFVGIDTNEQYLELSKKRFENLASIMKRREVHYQVSSEEQPVAQVCELPDMYEAYSDSDHVGHKKRAAVGIKRKAR